MARSPRRVLVTLALAAGLALGTAGTAGAETLTVNDKRGDLVSFSYTEEDEEVTAPRPNVANGDIVRTVFHHTADRVAVRVKFAELKRAGEFRGDFLTLVTNEGVRRDVSIFAGPRMWAGEAEMTRPNGNSVTCSVRHTIDYDLNVVAASFPRSCLSDPRWIRVGVGSFWLTSGTEILADDAQRADGVGERLVWSPRVRRG